MFVRACNFKGMRKFLSAGALLFLLFSCRKAEMRTGFSEATYKLTFTGLWTSPQFTVPYGAHFSPITGTVHNAGYGLWREGSLASPGLEALAEVGNQSFLLAEIDSVIAGKGAIAPVTIPAIGPAESISRTIYCNSNFSCLSLASMVAPSPDWFVGVNSLTLYRNGDWLSDTAIQLKVHDAGTEEGDVFGYNNPATVPQEKVQLLTAAKATVLAAGNSSLPPIATVRITKQ